MLAKRNNVKCKVSEDCKLYDKKLDVKDSVEILHSLSNLLDNLQRDYKNLESIANRIDVPEPCKECGDKISSPYTLKEHLEYIELIENKICRVINNISKNIGYLAGNDELSETECNGETDECY